MSDSHITLMEKRIRELRSEYQSGQEQMHALDARRAQLQETMTRISGAIQVLEEMLETERPNAAPKA